MPRTSPHTIGQTINAPTAATERNARNDVAPCVESFVKTSTSLELSTAVTTTALVQLSVPCGTARTVDRGIDIERTK